ncbi:MAG TPA: YicC/YloC family endoribonuclease, partial [Polyangiaceae bacterium]|nr:YicC/YloC family endoribonuclease [Polyangiaceae bacterium]
MTGYGAGEAAVGGGTLGVEARTVNHRALEVRVHLPPELSDAALVLEQAARARLSRGRCEIVVRAQGAWAGAPRLDVGRARAAFAELGRLRDELAPGEPLPLGLLAAVPGLFAA